MKKESTKEEKILAIKRIIAERRRQIEQEGWTPEHDDTHREGELGKAGFCYLLIPFYSDHIKNGEQSPPGWPWDEEWWKPTPNNRVRELEKAGALVLAEIERLQRLYNKIIDELAKEIENQTL